VFLPSDAGLLRRLELDKRLSPRLEPAQPRRTQPLAGGHIVALRAMQ